MQAGATFSRSVVATAAFFMQLALGTGAEITLEKKPSPAQLRQQRRDLSSAGNPFGRIAPVLESILVPLRGAWGGAAMHPASAVRHGWRMA
jgi:hypothetical protein